MEAKSQPLHSTVVLDTNVFIKMIDVREKYPNSDFCTVPDVVGEIRDENVPSHYGSCPRRHASLPRVCRSC